MTNRTAVVIIVVITLVAVSATIYYAYLPNSGNIILPPSSTNSSTNNNNNQNSTGSGASKHVVYDYETDQHNITQVQIEVLAIIPEKQLNSSKFSGADLGQRISQADQECGDVPCQINVDEVDSITTPIILSDNRILTFKPGTYIVSAPIRLGNDNEVIGSGNSTIFVRDPKFFEGLGADERAYPAANFNNIQDADMFNVVGKTNVILQNFQIDGSTTAIGYYLIEGQIPKPTGKMYEMPRGKQTEIRLTDSSNIAISKLNIREVQTHAVGGSGVSNLVIQDCDFSSNGWNKYQLIWLGQAHNQNILIKNNLIHGSSHAGLYLEYTNNAVIEKNIFDHNRENTFYTGPGAQIGLQVHTYNISIVNNTIINAGYTPANEVPKRNKPLLGHGIEVHGYNTTIIDNVISDNAGFGITLKNNEDFVFVFPDEEILPAHNILITSNTITGNGFAIGADVPINEEPGIYDITLKDNITDKKLSNDISSSIPEN